MPDIFSKSFMEYLAIAFVLLNEKPNKFDFVHFSAKKKKQKYEKTETRKTFQILRIS